MLEATRLLANTRNLNNAITDSFVTSVAVHSTKQLQVRRRRRKMVAQLDSHLCVTACSTKQLSKTDTNSENGF